MDELASVDELVGRYVEVQRALRSENYSTNETASQLRKLAGLRLRIAELRSASSVGAQAEPSEMSPEGELVHSVAGPPSEVREAPPDNQAGRALGHDSQTAGEAGPRRPSSPNLAETVASQEVMMAGNGLVLRILVEGPVGSGKSTALRELASQFRTRVDMAGGEEQALQLEWCQFTAGVFEEVPINFELVSYSGNPDRLTRQSIRSTVDAAIVVVESSPEAMGDSYRYVSELLEDQARIAPNDRPVLSVFAHKSDLPGSLDADAVAAELLVDSAIMVVGTNKERRGFLYGFAVTTGEAIRRAQKRDELGLDRTDPEALRALLAMTANGRRSSASVDQPGSDQHGWLIGSGLANGDAAEAVTDQATPAIGSKPAVLGSVLVDTRPSTHTIEPTAAPTESVVPQRQRASALQRLISALRR